MSEIDFYDRNMQFLKKVICFISAMFVDIGANHSVIDRVKLSYVYDEIDSFEVIILNICNGILKDGLFIDEYSRIMIDVLLCYM